MSPTITVTVGILCGIGGGPAYYLIAILLPKALVHQGAAVSSSSGLSTPVFAASIPGKLFNGFIMEIIGMTSIEIVSGALPEADHRALARLYDLISHKINSLAAKFCAGK